jgi:hypothetical protein
MVMWYSLSEHDQDATVQDNMAVKIAAKLGSVDMVRLLHEYGADLKVIDIREICSATPKQDYCSEFELFWLICLCLK